jgi:hypothetical protein
MGYDHPQGSRTARARHHLPDRSEEPEGFSMITASGGRFGSARRWLRGDCRFAGLAPVERSYVDDSDPRSGDEVAGYSDRSRARVRKLGD